MTLAAVIDPTLPVTAVLSHISQGSKPEYLNEHTPRVVVISLSFQSSQNRLALDDLELHALDLVVKEAIQRHDCGCVRDNGERVRRWDEIVVVVRSDGSGFANSLLPLGALRRLRDELPSDRLSSKRVALKDGRLSKNAWQFYVSLRLGIRISFGRTLGATLNQPQRGQLQMHSILKATRTSQSFCPSPSRSMSFGLGQTGCSHGMV
jgi:hypothetical protein